jgi:hypothetical protein
MFLREFEQKLLRECRTLILDTHILNFFHPRGWQAHCAASTVSLKPTALVTATSVDNRGFPRADNSRCRLSRSMPAAVATFATPLASATRRRAIRRTAVLRHPPMQRSGTRRQTSSSRVACESCTRHARRSLYLFAFHCMRILGITCQALQGQQSHQFPLTPIGSEGQRLRAEARSPKAYFLYCVGCGPFSSVSRSQIQPSRV